MSHEPPRPGHLAFVTNVLVMRTRLAKLVSIGLAFAFVATAGMPLGEAQRRRATERITLVVEVIDREETPIIPCGIFGAQPRDVTAQVIAVEEGTYATERILLSWPMCALGVVMPGHRYRIHIRRFTDTPATPETRYRVRGFDALD